jgi:L-gulono-1,4-lactone dehydrogenase
VTARAGLWTNWAQSVACRPARVESPRDPAEVAEVLATARRDGLSVKPVGAGHSFTPVAATDGVQVRLDRLAGLIRTDFDPESGSGTATAAAGTTLRVLNAELTRLGLGLANMGDIDVQTVSGAVATGTHGTGRDSASLSAQVVGLEIVLPGRGLVQCTADHEPELFQAARLGLGALGIVTSLTFRVEQAFLLHAVEEPGHLDEILERFDEYAATDHLDLYWFPFTDSVQVKRHRRTGNPRRPLSRASAWWVDAGENVGIEMIQRITRAAPRYTPVVNRLAGRLISRRDYVDMAPSVFTRPRRVRWHEMEYGLPRGVAVAAIREFRRLTTQGPWRIAFPVEIRLAPADDVWLSPGYGRETVYIACHAYPRTDYLGWFAVSEELFASYGGRPHWGKLHTRDVGHLQQVYPRLAEFRDIRNLVDPDRVMGNAYLRHVLGD